MKKSNWQRAKEIILADLTPGMAFSRKRGEIIAMLRKKRVGDLDGNWIDQLLRSLVDTGKLRRAGKRGAMTYWRPHAHKALARPVADDTFAEMTRGMWNRWVDQFMKRADAPGARLIIEIQGKRVAELNIAKVSR